MLCYVGTKWGKIQSSGVPRRQKAHKTPPPEGNYLMVAMMVVVDVVVWVGMGCHNMRHN
jgi:hypothetical protein